MNSIGTISTIQKYGFAHRQWQTQFNALLVLYKKVRWAPVTNYYMS